MPGVVTGMLGQVSGAEGRSGPYRWALRRGLGEQADGGAPQPRAGLLSSGLWPVLGA